MKEQPTTVSKTAWGRVFSRGGIPLAAALPVNLRGGTPREWLLWEMWRADRDGLPEGHPSGFIGRYRSLRECRAKASTLAERQLFSNREYMEGGPAWKGDI